MKIKHLFFGFILGIIIFILNSCGENPQAVVIEEKPKDTIKTEEEIVLKIEELDSIYVNFSGVKGKFYSSDSDSRNNPPFTENEYIDDFKFNQKININDIFIKYSKNDTITNEQIEKIINDLNIMGEFSNLEKGLNTPVGVNGSKLSGGQKQLVWCLRILLSDPEIILMDEPTASLDQKSKDLLFKMLDMVMSKKDKTVIMITHDPYLSFRRNV